MQERMDAETVMNLLRPMPVHQRVSTLRKLYRMSQVVLAKRIKVDRGSVSSWESEPGQDRSHSPSEEMRDRMAYLFGIPAYVLTPDFGMQNYKQLGLVASLGEVTPEMQNLHVKARWIDQRTRVERANVEQEVHPAFVRVNEKDRQPTEEEAFNTDMARPEDLAPPPPEVVMPPPPGVTRL